MINNWPMHDWFFDVYSFHFPEMLWNAFDRNDFSFHFQEIPVQSKKLYLKILIDKVELLIKRMQWKALFFENETESTFNYGFKTCKSPPQYKELMEFEEYFQNVISNVQFRRVNDDFQNRLKNDIRSIQSSKKSICLRR